MAEEDTPSLKVRRHPIRALLQCMSRTAFGALTQIEVLGRENLPRRGPLIVVSNHFSFLDPALLVGLLPWPLDFIGGHRMPNAPGIVTIIPRMWGILPVFRGSVASRRALRDAEQVLNGGGILGIYPEAGSWATVLRPPRPGAAFLAVRTGAPLLPIGVDGLTEVFTRLQRGQRARVRVHIGEMFGPLRACGHGHARREQIESLGHEIMRHIAALIPAERQGYYSPDPALREAALSAAVYPWQDQMEA